MAIMYVVDMLSEYLIWWSDDVSDDQVSDDLILEYLLSSNFLFGDPQDH